MNALGVLVRCEQKCL